MTYAILLVIDDAPPVDVTHDFYEAFNPHAGSRISTDEVGTVTVLYTDFIVHGECRNTVVACTRREVRFPGATTVA